MLIKIGFDAPRPACARDAVDLLMECHARIRSHSALALRLARGDGDAPARAEAAGQLARYFGIALPLHVADEDVSLALRLTAAGLEDALAEALEEMNAQHQEIEAEFERLIPLWTALHLEGREPEDAAAATGRLAEVLERHLELEERVIFPAVRARLTPADHQALIAEFRARR